MYIKDGKPYYDKTRYLERLALNAVMAHDVKKIKRLIQKNSAVYTKSFYNELFEENIKHGGSLPIIKQLLKLGADPNAKSGVIMWIFIHGDIPIIKECLKYHIDFKKNKTSTLIISIEHRNYEVTNFLLNKFSLENLNTNKNEVAASIISRNDIKVMEHFFSKLDITISYLKENKLFKTEDLIEKKVFINTETRDFLDAFQEKENIKQNIVLSSKKKKVLKL